MKTLKKAFAIFFGIFLATLVFEAAIRVFVPTSDFFWEFDSHVGVKLIPGKKGRWVKRNAFDVPVQTNSHGFRDIEHTYENRDGVTRIVLLGDSFIEALQVPFDESITPLLAARLRGRGIDADLVNLGVSGSGTARQYLMLREYGLRYHPNLVLLFLVGNDISDNSKRLQGKPYLPYPIPASGGVGVARDEIGRLRFSPFADRTSVLGFATSFLRSHSEGYRAVREAVETSAPLKGLLYRLRIMSTPPERVNRPHATNFGFYEIYRLIPTPLWAEAWALTEDVLVATRDLAESHGARFAVVLVPSAWEVYSSHWNHILEKVPAMRDVPMDLDQPTRRLRAFLAANGIPHVSLLTPFRARAPHLPPLYIVGDAHWTIDGHRLAADLLSEPAAHFLIPSPEQLADPHGRSARSHQP